MISGNPLIHAKVFPYQTPALCVLKKHSTGSTSSCADYITTTVLDITQSLSVRVDGAEVGAVEAHIMEEFEASKSDCVCGFERGARSKSLSKEGTRDAGIV